METFVDWLYNGSPSWEAYLAFMSGRLIALDKQPGMHPVEVGETWRRIFAKIMLNITVPEATIACQHGQLCVGLKEGVDGAFHGVQDMFGMKNRLRRIWDS